MSQDSSLSVIEESVPPGVSEVLRFTGSLSSSTGSASI